MVIFQSVHFRICQLWKIVFISVFLILIKIIISDNFSFFPLFTFYSLRNLFQGFVWNLLTWFSLVPILLFIELHKICYIIFSVYLIFLFILHIKFSIISISIATCYVFQFLRCNLRNPFDIKESLNSFLLIPEINFYEMCSFFRYQNNTVF